MLMRPIGMEEVFEIADGLSAIARLPGITDNEGRRRSPDMAAAAHDRIPVLMDMAAYVQLGRRGANGVKKLPTGGQGQEACVYAGIVIGQVSDGLVQYDGERTPRAARCRLG